MSAADRTEKVLRDIHVLFPRQSHTTAVNATYREQERDDGSAQGIKCLHV